MVLKSYPQAAGRRLFVLVAEAAADYCVYSNIAIILLIKAVHISVRVYPIFIYIECLIQRSVFRDILYAWSPAGNQHMPPVAG